MFRLSWRLVSIAILSSLLMVLNPSQAQAQRILRLGIVSGDNDPIGLGANRFATALNEISAGKLQVKVIGRSALGGLNDHWAQLQTGALDMTVIDVPAIALVKQARFVSVLTTPFLFRDTAHLRQFGESTLFRKMMADVYEGANIRFIGHVNVRAPRVISTTSKPVRTMADLKGLKIRVPPAPILMKVIREWGGVPTPTAPAEMYIALKTGVVDGNEVDMIQVARGSTIKVVRHVTPVNHTQAAIGAWMGKATWEQLSDQQRAWVTEAAEQVGRIGWDDYDNQLQWARDEILAKGLTIHEPDRASFEFVTQKIVDELEGKLWPKGTVASIRQLH